MKDHKKAIVMGAQTFGKGSVQTILRMDNGAGLRLTTARYYTPNGTSIQTTGITPDIIVPTEIMKEEKDDDENSKKKHIKFLREKDLKGHIKNGQLKNKKSRDKKGKSSTKLTKEEEETRKQLERDPQLKSALALLKGLNVFNNIN